MLEKNKQRVFEKQAEVINAMAHPVRIAIIDFLKDGEQCVCDIAEFVGSERSNVSKHLSVLVSCGVLEFRKEGLKVIYNLKARCIMDFFKCITTCVRQQAKDSENLLKVL